MPHCHDRTGFVRPAVLDTVDDADLDEGDSSPDAVHLDSPDALPSGLVTFVFTDIEASTRLYKLLGNRGANEVFDTHNDCVRRALADHGGREVHTEGDSFFAVFESPQNAIRSCVDMQRRIAATDWPAGGEVKVRIGIHCGLAAPRHGDYMALSVHQAARVMSSASGGQILVSGAVADRLEPMADFSLARLGVFRLRDFEAPPTLFRVVSPDVALGQQPPRATPACRHNLVKVLNSFVGRDADLVTVAGLLESGRALTLVGPGGIGKTRLATEVGLDHVSAWADGVWMADLSEVADPELIADEIASAVGMGSLAVDDGWDELLEHIGDKTMLLVVDNAEHLIAEVAAIVVRLLRGCPHLAILTTSREPLNSPGEVVYRLPTLDQLTTDALAEPAAVQLFIDRAHAVLPDYEWTSTRKATIAEICNSLDGLPLAIEIAAARAGVLGLGEIRSGLDDRFRLLRSRDRSLPARQRTMEGLLGWSYQLLDENEQRALRRLAVFGGSFSIDAARSALAGEGIVAADIPELIWSLVDKSLVTADLSDSATRYRLLESVQQYAMRLLIDHDDPVRCALGLSRWLLDRVAPWLTSDRRWLGEVAVELATIRRAVDLIGDAAPETAQQLMCSVGRYHDSAQSYRAGVEELTKALLALPAQTPSQLALLAGLADLHLRMAHLPAASSLLDQATEIQRSIDPPEWDDIAVVRVRAELELRSGHFDAAIARVQEALAAELSPRGQARMLSIRGIAESNLGRLDDGFATLKSALGLFETLDHVTHVAIARANLAEAAWRLEDPPTAAHYQQLSLDDGLAIGQPLAIATSLIMAAQLADLRSNWRDALRLYGCASIILEQGSHALYQDEESALHQLVASAQQRLGSATTNSLLASGAAMSVVDAAALASGVFAAETRDHREALPPQPDDGQAELEFSYDRRQITRQAQPV